MNKWKKFTAACMGAAMVGTTAFGSSTVFADDTVTLDVCHLLHNHLTVIPYRHL